MEIKKNTDNSILRKQSVKENMPVNALLIRKVTDISTGDRKGHTLLAVCPNSENVLKAALRSAKRVNSPIMFAATLNQVDIDGGYTGLTPNDLIRKLKEESYRIGYDGPTIVGVDHGGPWLKDIQVIERWGLIESTNWIKKSFKAAILAGYDLLHVDPTVDIFNKNLIIETVVERTVELISYSESFRKNNNIKPISYEVGTEEVHGGLADIKIFNKFLTLLKKGLKNKNLEYIWPVFIVAKVGTDLHTATFDPEIAREISGIVSGYGSYIKGHYTDFVANPEDYPISGMGAANVGPEFTIAEYDAFSELCRIENDLVEKDKAACASRFMEILTRAVLNSGRWKKWLLEGEKDFESLSNDRKEWIIKTGCRYVWAKPEIKSAQIILYSNLYENGIDAENWVLMKIESIIDKYLRAFNLIDLNNKLI
ncbi:MAG: class II D-tagatose-bisphosphate aldolase, non-catalytic subunit [Actinobacteria bacterium]|nr:class II D-tagatose-bisphosphate aldolase, non-catalytic subunit [Actinomycetota bacterium]